MESRGGWVGEGWVGCVSDVAMLRDRQKCRWRPNHWAQMFRRRIQHLEHSTAYRLIVGGVLSNYKRCRDLHLRACVTDMFSSLYRACCFRRIMHVTVLVCVCVCARCFPWGGGGS